MKKPLRKLRSIGPGADEERGPDQHETHDRNHGDQNALAVAAVTGAQPIEMILFAQFTNGLLLPIVAAFLLCAANRGDLLGARVNGIGANIAGVWSSC